MRPQRTKRPPTRRGFTLVELAVCLTILASILTALGWFQISSQSTYRQTAARAEAESKARHASVRVMKELIGVGTNTLVPDPTSNFGTSTLVFQKPTAVSNVGVVTWGTASRLELQLDEADDGIDNDGDGQIDERRLALVRGIGTANETTTVICHGIPELGPGEFGNNVDDDLDGIVDEAGFNVQRIADLLRISLTVERALSDGTLVQATSETSIVLRN